MNDSKWRAIAEKRPADFIYAVKTTGKLQLRLRFQNAPPRRNFRPRRRRAGYRACKKCRPDSPPSPPQNIVAACRRLEDLESVPALSDLAKESGMSARNFHRQFTRYLGLTPKQYAEAARGNLRTAESVTTAVYDSGFESGAHVYENPAAQLGMTPAAYKSGGGDEFVRAAIGESLLGKVLIAATGRGVCAVEFGDSESELCARLKQQFPRAEIDSDDNQFRELVRKTIRLINEPRGAHNLPLDIRATAFQRRVWRALQNIPAGEIAKTCGQIAVIFANRQRRQNDIGANHNSNPPAIFSITSTGRHRGQIAVIIPCHRAIGKRRQNLNRTLAMYGLIRIR